jgi:hypothetical protein
VGLCGRDAGQQPDGCESCGHGEKRLHVGGSCEVSGGLRSVDSRLRVSNLSDFRVEEAFIESKSSCCLCGIFETFLSSI